VFDPETGEIAEQTDVSEGDFLLLPLPSHDTGVESDYPEEELLGWFIGDGHATEYGNVKFSFAQHAEEQIAIITDLLDRLGYPYSTFENSRGDLSIYAPKLACRIEWAVDTGAKANDVRIPSEAFTWDSSRVAALLRGLFDAEGSVSDGGRLQFNSTSKRLTDDVGWLLQRLGILTNRQEIDRSNRAGAGDIHRLNIPSTYGQRFEETIGFRLDHKAVRVTDSDTNPDTAVPVSTPLRELKEALNARGQESPSRRLEGSFGANTGLGNAISKSSPIHCDSTQRGRYLPRTARSTTSRTQKSAMKWEVPCHTPMPW
jgi:hypothetical protein